MTDLRPPLVGYSLWLMPKDGAESKQLDQLIAWLANSFGTDRFMGHVSLLGLLDYGGGVEELKEIVQEQIGSQRCLQLELTGVETSEVFLKSVYIDVKLTAELRDFYQQVRGKFGEEFGRNPLEPHWSMAYGVLDAGNRTAAQSIIGQVITFPLWLTFDKLALVDANGGPADWRVIESWTLK